LQGIPGAAVAGPILPGIWPIDGHWSGGCHARSSHSAAVISRSLKTICVASQARIPYLQTAVIFPVFSQQLNTSPMNRTQFLKSLLSGGLLVSLPLDLVKDEKKLARVLMFRRFVAGFQFGEGMDLLDEMKAGDELILVREPENPHDDQAVAVYWKQHRIGYVPAVDNEIPNLLLLQGLALTCKIETFDPSEYPWEACELGIYLLYPQALMHISQQPEGRKQAA
jgi:hypothetical protein